MTHSVITYCVAALAALAAVTSAKMIIVEAGKHGKVGPTVTSNMAFCPSTFSSKGFSILCTEVDGPVTFFIDGALVRKEKFAPYAIAGDRPAPGIFAWTSYPQNGFIVNCRSASGNESANIRIECPADVVSAPTITPIVLKKVSPTPAAVDLPITSSPSPVSAERVIGALASPTATATALPTPAPSPPPMTIPSGTNCIKMLGYMNMALTTGWEKDGSTVWFKKGDTNSGPVVQKTADVDYMFVAPSTGTFAVSVDMDTPESKSAIEVYVKFRYGLNLLRAATATKPKSLIKKTGSDYVTTYSLKTGPTGESLTNSEDPHAICTGTPLRAGRMYKLTIGGRTPNVKINSILMFPCEGDECAPGSAVWKAGVAKCV